MNDVIDLKIYDSISLIHFELKTPLVALGEELEFTFTLQNVSDAPMHLDIRYQLDSTDAHGTQTIRTYKISSKKCPVGFLLYNHSHTLLEDSILVDNSTSVSSKLAFFPGTRTIPCVLHILVNGQILHSTDFQVII